jgi:hypothetical protein
MDQRFHRGFTASEKTELWDRWRRGDSLKAIGRAFATPLLPTAVRSMVAWGFAHQL